MDFAGHHALSISSVDGGQSSVSTEVLFAHDGHDHAMLGCDLFAHLEAAGCSDHEVVADYGSCTLLHISWTGPEERLEERWKTSDMLHTSNLAW